MQFGFGADSIFTSYTYVVCTENYWRKFGETYQGIWNAENKADFFRLPSAIPDTIFLSVKNTGLKKLIRVRVIFIICLKLIIVDIKYH